MSCVDSERTVEEGSDVAEFVESLAHFRLRDTQLDLQVEMWDEIFDEK